MSVDYDNCERLFNANIEASFKDMGSSLTVISQEIRELVIAAYKQDLQALDAKVRVLDDVVAIVKIGDAETSPENKYRKIRQVLVAKDLVEN